MGKSERMVALEAEWLEERRAKRLEARTQCWRVEEGAKDTPELREAAQEARELHRRVITGRIGAPPALLVKTEYVFGEGNGIGEGHYLDITLVYGDDKSCTGPYFNADDFPALIAMDAWEGKSFYCPISTP